MEMNIDNVVALNAQISRDCFRLTGEALKPLAQLSFNPIANNFSKYLIEKGRQPQAPTWYTKNKVVWENDKVMLRKFNHGNHGNPILFIAPEAGHDSRIVDYGPKQSLVECALKHYPGDVYVVDKLPATFKHTEYSLDDCIQSLDDCVSAIGEPATLVGLCQGGWQSAIYTSIHPEKINALVLAAAPIDFHAGDAKICQIATTMPFAAYKTMVNMGGGNMPGAFIVQGFMLLNAVDRFLGDDIALFNNIDNPIFKSRSHTFNSWYRLTQPVPGRMYLEIVKELFKDNKLIKGELEIFGKKVDLANITHPVWMIAGTKDDITPPPQLFALKDYIRSEKITEITAPAGHIGVFMAKNIIKNYWPAIFKRIVSAVEQSRSASTSAVRTDVNIKEAINF